MSLKAVDRRSRVRLLLTHRFDRSWRHGGSSDGIGGGHYGVASLILGFTLHATADQEHIAWVEQEHATAHWHIVQKQLSKRGKETRESRGGRNHQPMNQQQSL